MRASLLRIAVKVSVHHLAGVAVIAGCAARLLTHDPDMAARSALEFARVTFIDGDLDRGYSLLSGDAKRTTPIEEFHRILSNMHPRGHPAHLEAIEFERIPGKEAMNIFLQGENREERFFYRLLMQGGVREGYRVSGLWRGTGPYPPSRTRERLAAPASF